MKNECNMGLTPPEIVKELDKYVVGQLDAKKALAIALRNRERRKRVDEKIRTEIIPKNILMVGPTGVGKTEIARRLAKIGDSPFIKVEATKFTEVGYVGRDVESIIRDLVSIAINLVKERYRKIVEKEARIRALERTIDSLAGKNASEDTREKFRKKILSGELDKKEIDIRVDDTTSKPMNFDIPGINGASVGIMNLSDIFGKVFDNKKQKKKTLNLKDAYQALVNDEIKNMMDESQIISEALELVENEGIVFIDEIDKISSNNEDKRSSNISREGVQRDLLPLIEGTIVSTKYGSVKTDHILFIASGAFHLSTPSDIIPELQGRLPIRVELQKLCVKDMIRILSEPETSLIKQYVELIATENIDLIFKDSAIEKIANYAIECNNQIEDIGARRLHTILEKLLEEVSFNAGSIEEKKFVIDVEYTNKILKNLIKTHEHGKFIL